MRAFAATFLLLSAPAVAAGGELSEALSTASAAAAAGAKSARSAVTPFEALKAKSDARFSKSPYGYRVVAELAPPPRRAAARETIPVVLFVVAPVPASAAVAYGERAMRAVEHQLATFDALYAQCGLAVEARSVVLLEPVFPGGPEALAGSCLYRSCKASWPTLPKDIRRLAADAERFGVPVFVVPDLHPEQAGVAFLNPRDRYSRAWLRLVEGETLAQLVLVSLATMEGWAFSSTLFAHELGHVMLTAEHDADPARFMYYRLGYPESLETRLSARECAKAVRRARSWRR